MKLNRRVRKGVHRDGFKHVHVDDVEAAEAVDQKNFGVSTVSLQNQSAYFNAIMKFWYFVHFAEWLMDFLCPQWRLVSSY